MPIILTPIDTGTDSVGSGIGTNAGLPFFTFADAVQHLLDIAGADSGDRQSRIAHRAVRSAYANFPAASNWSYYNTVGRVVTSAPYSTGTVVYDHTGGASERLLTLTDGEFPTWAGAGSILINNVLYDVERWLSTTTVRLSSRTNPGEDITTAATFSLFRDTYTLPVDWRASATLRDSARSFPELAFVSPEEWRGAFISQEFTNFPRMWAVTADPDNTRRFALRLYPPPDAAYNFDHVYVRQPVPVRTEEYATGRTSRTAGSRVVTGSSDCVWTSAMVGSIIRFSGDTTVPDGLEGDNPYVEEGQIESIESATSLTLVNSAESTGATKAYSISDLIDVAAGPMLTAFLRRCELEQAYILPKDSSLQQRTIAYQLALKEAMAADYRSLPEAAPHGTGSTLQLRGIPSGVTEG